MPSSTGTNAKSSSADGVEPDADLQRARARRAVRLLDQPGRDDERRAGERQERPARARPRRVGEVGEAGRQRRATRTPPGRRRCSSANGSATANPPSITTSCSEFTQRGAEQAAGGEVHRHDAAADERAEPARRAGEHVEDGGAGHQLRREDPQAAERDQHRDDAAHRRAVAVLEEVAGGVEVVRPWPAPRAAAPPRRRGRTMPGPPIRSTTTRSGRRGRRGRRRSTVAPAPMLAASIDEKMRPGPRLRPATKKSLLPRTSRDVHRPKPTIATE